jgi:hypothetical protein
MYKKRKKSKRRPERRKGVILLVVLSLLTLFAVVGISFVLYADAEAESSRIFREAAANPTLPDMDPEQAFAFIMAQLVYDNNDDLAGASSSLRGHSFARLMYGYNAGGDNSHPYTGVGRISQTTPAPAPAIAGFSNYNQLVNYRYYQGDGFVIDPEHISYRADPTAAANSYLGGINAPYTYPDGNNMLLAAMKADGTLLAVSGNRPFLFNPSPLNFNDTTNTNWTNRIGKYLTLRPRPVDNLTDAEWSGAGLPLPQNPDTLTAAQKTTLNTLIQQRLAAGKLFPYPEDTVGDVKSLVGFPGGNDSIWIDPGTPVMTTADGRKYKMLVAPLILDLDGRVNLNAHGNIRGQSNAHASNNGGNKTQINLSKVMNADQSLTPPLIEWQNLFIGNASRGGIPGRYGNSQAVGSVPVYGAAVPFYSWFDLDGCDEATGFVASAKWPLATAANSPTFPFPLVVPPALPNMNPPFTGSPTGYGNGSPKEWTNLPLLYNPLSPYAGGGGAGFSNADRAFAPSEMEALLRHGGTNTPSVTSTLQRLCPQNFGPQSGTTIANASQVALRIRNMVTTLSTHLERPAVSPYIWDPNDATTKYQYTTLGASAPFYPQGQPIPFLGLPAGTPLSSPPPSPVTGGDYQTGTWRASLGPVLSLALNKVDLNRKLADYYDPSAAFPATLQLTQTGPTLPNAAQAIADRQQLASDIFAAFQEACGIYTTSIGTTITAPTALNLPGDAQFEALRWLAQLSVNIVDFIDSDDYITPFNWFNVTGPPPLSFYVYGTEVPRVVLNEVYAELANDPADPTGANHFNLNFWLELLNTVQTDKWLVENGNQRLNMPTSVTGTTVGYDYPVYQVFIAQNAPLPANDTKIRQPWNVTGDPVGVLTQVDTFAGAQASTAMTTGGQDSNVILPNAGVYNPSANGLNSGFYVLGPGDATGKAIPIVDATAATTPVPTLSIPTVPAGANPRKGLTIQIPTANLPFTPMPNYTIVLKRLACPNIPPNPPPGGTLDNTKPYNPYVAVDYVESVLATLAGVPQLNDAVNATPQAGHTKTPVASRFSLGKRQPYAAHLTQLAQQAPVDPATNTALTGQPQTTFFRHNGVKSAGPPASTDTGPNGEAQTITVPFDWLTHLDRKLVSPMELLHVSGFKLHEVTQQFMQAGAAPVQFGHRAPWYDPSARIYRAFEFLTTADPCWGMPFGGRTVGKININTIWDPEVFRALCDASASNYFTQEALPATWPPTPTPTDDVDRIFLNFVNKRTPGWASTGLSATDHPLLPPSNGTYPPNGTPPPLTTDPQFPNNLGINDTLLQLGPDPSGTGQQPLFDPIYDQTVNTNLANLPVYSSAAQFGGNAKNNHPYLQKALLNKIYNNITTRSNVFAVFLTVGFFEVKDDTTRPVKLGAEIGKAEGRNIRHRMFAIVDRSQLQASPIGLQGTGANTAAAPKLWTITIPTSSLTDPRTGQTFPLAAGMVVSLDGKGQINPIVAMSGNPGQPPLTLNSEENAVITSVTPGSPNTTFTVNLNLDYGNPLTTMPPYPTAPATANFTTIKVYGNPGPWTKYDPRQDNLVVPYFSIID